MLRDWAENNILASSACLWIPNEASTGHSLSVLQCQIPPGWKPALPSVNPVGHGFASQPGSVTPAARVCPIMQQTLSLLCVLSKQWQQQQHTVASHAWHDRDSCCEICLHVSSSNSMQNHVTFDQHLDAMCCSR
jgi:hypothetical protein